MACVLSRPCAALLAAFTIFSSAMHPAIAEHRWTDPGHLRIGVSGNLETLNPLIGSQNAVADVAQFLFSGLIRFDDRGEAIPDAAIAVPTRSNGGISSDGKMITYRLRPNARFSDGTPLTAQDVVFTWQQIMNRRNNVSFQFPYDHATSVTAKNSRTLVVRLRVPYAPFVSSFFNCGVPGSILPRHLLAGKPDLNRDPFNVKPVGSGPYVLVRNDGNTVLEMIPNPYWFGAKPRLKRVTYRVIANQNTLLLSLLAHEIDFYYHPPVQQYRELLHVYGVATSAIPSEDLEMVIFNTGRLPFSEVRVRRAAAHALDWDQISRFAYLSRDHRSSGDIFPGSWAYTPQADPTPHNPARARALLDAAGWKVGADGTRLRNGKRLEVEISTVAGAITQGSAELLIQQGLRAVGFDVQIHNAPANILFGGMSSGGILASGKYDLAISGFAMNPDPDDSQISGPEYVPPHGGNSSRLRDVQLGKLQLRASSTYERAKRKALYVAVERRLGEVLPYHAILWRTALDAWNDDLHGVRPAPAVSDFWNIADWSL